MYVQVSRPVILHHLARGDSRVEIEERSMLLWVA